MFNQRAANHAACTDYCYLPGTYHLAQLFIQFVQRRIQDRKHSVKEGFMILVLIANCDVRRTPVDLSRI
jgi:hypothetical protein